MVPLLKMDGHKWFIENHCRLHLENCSIFLEDQLMCFFQKLSKFFSWIHNLPYTTWCLVLNCQNYVLKAALFLSILSCPIEWIQLKRRFYFRLKDKMALFTHNADGIITHSITCPVCEALLRTRSKSKNWISVMFKMKQDKSWWYQTTFWGPRAV